jgi:hypothetical protein
MKLSRLVKIASTTDKLPGGLGDEKTDEDFSADQIEKGVKVEMEHTTDPEIAREIVRDHLAEDPQYYDKLEKIDPHHARAAGKDPKIEKMREEIEDADRTIDQLKRRQEALTGPEVDPQTAEVIRTSIQRRIDAVQQDKTDIQTQIQEMIMQKCGKPGNGKGKK